MLAVPDHQAPLCLIRPRGQLGYALVHFGIRGVGRHPPGTLADNLVDKRAGESGRGGEGGACRVEERGDTASLALAVTLLHDQGHTAQALTWLHQRTQAGDTTAPGWIAQLQHTTG
ncbi:hypothetical protein QFZ24_000925 [Streptomyces phaeochromogenes]|uniref:hypothetical protein n=1 Tax=Streptomyces phaeochromogenes TaxID=1923 RepID=UPI00278F45E6|nr:hypothetical protein [Streptomyces phaeochromogenes]MDQ0947002.1 hypothetical protein [Streptomyces phaeochromogenes]